MQPLERCLLGGLLPAHALERGVLDRYLRFQQAEVVLFFLQLAVAGVDLALERLELGALAAVGEFVFVGTALGLKQHAPAPDNPERGTGLRFRRLLGAGEPVAQLGGRPEPPNAMGPTGPPGMCKKNSITSRGDDLGPLCGEVSVSAITGNHTSAPPEHNPPPRAPCGPEPANIRRDAA
ncbi:hypothetical protein [Nannocystis pusilla]|uniref:hypothetical protein n=1 Tax=Nannocystis pusilla TaxID=889268 RepID=UPI003B81E382